MASPASPKDYLEHPIETLDVGSLGTRRMLELALEKNARFLLTSTSECYGDPLVHPQVETYWGNVNPVGPRSCYDESKRFAEALTMAYHRKHGVRTNIARIFNTYGPRMKLNDGRVVPAFLDQALRDEPMTVFGIRLADAQLLLRERSGGWTLPPDAIGRTLSGESGKSARDDDSGVRRTHSADDRHQIGDRLPASCPKTIRNSANPTSPKPARCWDGSRAWRWKTACARRWRTSGGSPRPWCDARDFTHYHSGTSFRTLISVPLVLRSWKSSEAEMQQLPIQSLCEP